MKIFTILICLLSFNMAFAHNAEQQEQGQKSVARLPLFEEFTSSTCPPCATFNIGFFNDFVYENGTQFSLIKYQMNWPGSGDPYYTPEGGLRRNYYGVTGVPSMRLEGQNIGISTNHETNDQVFKTRLQEALSEPAYVDISGNFAICGDNINISGTLMPFTDYSSARLHVVILETVTYGNAATNGETEFHHVMHKMMPNANGTTVNLTDQQPYEFSFEYNMSTTNVEDMDNLIVVVFLQNHSTREIYQSAYFHRNEIAYFNINDSEEDVETDRNFEVSFCNPVTFPDGTEITDENVYEMISFFREATSSEDVDFTASINQEKTLITIVPDNALDFLSSYTIQTSEVKSAYYDVAPAEVSFTTRDTHGVPVVSLNIQDGAQHVSIDRVFTAEFNQPIKTADGQQLNNENVHEVISFRIEDQEGEAVPFIAEINDDKTLINFNSEALLDFSQQYYIGLSSVMGLDGDVSDPVSITFTTRNQAGSPEITFNIQDQATDIPVDKTITASFDQSVRMPDGTAISNYNVHQLILLTHENAGGQPVDFTATINGSKTQISIQAVDPMEAFQLHFLEIGAVMGIDHDITDPASISFTTGPALGVESPWALNSRIFPNPAHTTIFVEIPFFEGEASVNLIDNNGNMVKCQTTSRQEFSLDVSSVAPGLYFLEIISEKGRVINKIQIIR